MNPATPLMSEVPMAPLVVRRPPGAPGERTRLERIFTQAIFSYLIVNKRIKCYFRENPSGYKSLTLEKSTA